MIDHSPLTSPTLSSSDPSSSDNCSSDSDDSSSCRVSSYPSSRHQLAVSNVGNSKSTFLGLPRNDSASSQQEFCQDQPQPQDSVKVLSEAEISPRRLEYKVRKGRRYKLEYKVRTGWTTIKSFEHRNTKSDFVAEK